MLNKKAILMILVLTLSTLFPYLAAHSLVGLSKEATLCVGGTQEIGKFVCDIFEVNITVSMTDFVNLAYFEIYLDYDPGHTSKFEVLEAEKEDVFRFCKLFEKKPEEINNAKFDIDPQEKVVCVGCAPSDWLLAHPVTGHITLATIKVKCTETGLAAITIITDDTILWDSSANRIDYDTAGGRFTIRERQDQPKEIDQDYTWCTDMLDFYGQHLFNIEADNVVLDLNGHIIINSKGVGHAIEVEKKNNVTIKNGVIQNWQYGIEIVGCNHINIINITFLKLTEAILIEDSSNVHICNNKISHSGKEALRLHNCTSSEVSRNVFSDNIEYGIVMEQDSTNNIICNNTIKDNYDSGGISIHESPHYESGQVDAENFIFNNNFINNTDRNGQTNHVESYKSTNVWNSNYPEGGNYWDDYDEHDKVSGKNGTIPGPDGIGDKEYSIAPNNKDEYPLMNLYNSTLLMFDEAYACPVAIYSDSSITNFNGTSVETRACEMSFDCSDGTYCKIIIPKKLSSGPLTVLIDNIPTKSILDWDDTHSFINITYSEGNHKVTIKADIDAFCLSSFTEFPDFNQNGVIDIGDISAVAKHHGETRQDRYLDCSQDWIRSN